MIMTSDSKMCFHSIWAFSGSSIPNYVPSTTVASSCYRKGCIKSMNFRYIIPLRRYTTASSGIESWKLACVAFGRGGRLSNNGIDYPKMNNRRGQTQPRS